ncbi:type IV secretory system conjugative DNA transfer family protein [Hahella chejuensis]|nr:type IV secretion system DNA-binding domain-containing protein [Hahella chejuensis]
MSQLIEEALTKSFYAWEMRGRGWLSADEAVQLEPPYRPFFLLPEHEAPLVAPYDDGVHLSFWQRLFQRRPDRQILPQKSYEEQPPFPRALPYEPVSFQLCIPPEYKTNHERMCAMLRTLTGAMETISFELVGTDGVVECALTCHQIDAEYVGSTLRAFLPEGSVHAGDDLLLAAWDGTNTQARIDFGLFREFFIPLVHVRNFAIDPYIALVSALSRAGEGECLCMQVLIEPVKNPWARTIMDALTDEEDGSCFFADAPEFLQFAKMKTASPLFAVSLRVGAQADELRIPELLAGFDGVFDQYGSVHGNELFPLDVTYYPTYDDDTLLYSRASHHTGMILSLEELVGLVHIPDESVRGPLVREIAGFPEEDENGLVIGSYQHDGERIPATIPHIDRFAHTHVVGASGTGKSSLLLSMMLQDARGGNGCMLIDPHGDLTDDILQCMPENRFDDVIVFDPSDEQFSIGLNILQAESSHEKNLLVSDLVSTISRLSTSWGDVMTTVLAEAVLALVESDEAYSLLDLRHFLSDASYRAKCLAPITDQAIQAFWEHDFPRIGSRSIGPLVTRLDSFLRARMLRYVLGQPRGGIHLGNIMQEGKILLARLPLGLMGATNAQLLGSLLVTKCQQYAIARQSIPKQDRKPFFLYIDECQHFVTPSLASIFGEGRKYKLGLTLSHQYLSQLSRAPEVADAVLGNAHSRIVFRVGGNDARSLAQGFSVFDHQNIVSLGRGEALVRRGNMGNEVAIRTDYIEVPDAFRQREALVSRSREKYGVAVSQIEQLFQERYVRKEAPQKAVAPSRQEPAEDQEKQKPAQHIKEPERAAPKTPTPPPAIQEDAEEKDTKRATTQHIYLQNLIKRLAEERGCRAVIEEPCPGGVVDVALYRGKVKVACEISVTTDMKHELQNIEKCRAAGTYTQILSIVQKANMRLRMEQYFKKEDAKKLPVLVIKPEQIQEYIESLFPPIEPTTSSVKGYRVKVKRGSPPPDGGRSVIAEIIARSVRKI